MNVRGYSFDALLYEGSSTLVYAGVRDSDGAAVVGKLVRAHRRDLAHEYLVLQKVAGPGVVETLGLFDGSEGQVLVQRRFGTGSLTARLGRGRLDVARALGIALQLAHVLARIHDARIVHRDIKPANLLHDAATDAIAVVDFGVAAELPVGARTLPPGDVSGTPGYMSPEHTGRTNEGCDVRSDLYSLGVTLYELLTGGLPFSDRDLLAVMAAHLSRMPEPPHRRVPSIPRVVSELVMKLLAKAPDDRYQSARGLAADLERCVTTLDGGDVPGFALGGSDLRRVRFPRQVLGRRDEQAAVDRAFGRAAGGAPTLVLLSGRDGSGRSALVRALVRTTAAGSSLALGGWTGASERPLAGLADALGTLARDLLLLDEDQLAALRQQFATRVGHAGQAVLEVVPALRDVLGPQPELVELGPAAARGRLQHGFRGLVGALGSPAPLVLALRGFEHADPATRALIEALLQAPDCRALIVLIAGDPAAFGALRERPDAVAIELGPLPVAAVQDGVTAALGCDAERGARLGEALHGKTAGNPLMLIRWLDHLVETGVIAHRDGAYAWSVDAVLAAPPPATLGALAAQRIAELDPDTQRALAAVAASDDPIDAGALAAMLAVDAASARRWLAGLAHEGLIVEAGGRHRAADPVIAQTALAAVGAGEVAGMRGRLGAHLIAACGPAPAGPDALRAALALSRGAIELPDADRIRAAEVSVIAGEHAMAAIAYDAAVALFTAAAALLGDTGWERHRDLQFRIELGRGRALMMLGRHAEADAQFQALARRELSPAEIGLAYAAWADKHSMVLDRARAIEIDLDGLARLGIRLPAEPSRLRPLAAIRLNQRALARMTADDHVRRPDATDPTAIAAVRLLGNLTVPTVLSQRMGLYALVTEAALGLILKHGHARTAAPLLAVHACFLHAMLGDYAAARQIYEACLALDAQRPAPEFAARTSVVFHYMVSPWFGSWQDAAARLCRAVQLGVEAGDLVFSALSASSAITLLSMTGAPLDRLVAAIEGWRPFLRGDAGVVANAANITHLAGKLTRAEPIVQADLDRVTDVPRTAGSMRNNAMVNLGLALALAGHDAQVRTWLDEIRATFPVVNFAQPHRMTLWLLDALFAARDARAGQPERRRDAERALDAFRTLRAATRSTSTDPAIAVIEAQLARLDGDLDRALGLFARAVRDARARDLTPIVAYASEQRAELLDEAGYPDDALLYYGEAVAAYRRWMHMTKVAELEQAHPALRARGPVRDETRRPGEPAPHVTIGGARRTGIDPGGTVNDRLDLVTVLEVSQRISTELTGSGVVRAVLAGIAENAGAERAVFVMRAADGSETVYGEVSGGTYRDIGAALDGYPELPRSILRVVRRTGRPLVVADAASDAGHAGDPYVAARRSRSIAGVPVRRKGEITGFVVLENGLVAGAFTPQLVSLTQALVAQAAISLDNASLYQDLEARVDDRTRALREAQQQLVASARKAGMADIAVEVLHNVRNALNGVHVSAQLVASQLAGSRLDALRRVAAMLEDHRDHLAEFLAADDRGGKLAAMLATLATTLGNEQAAMLRELGALRSRVDEVVAVVGELEATAADRDVAVLEAPGVVLGVATATIRDRARGRIAISTDDCPPPGAKVDKFKGLDILVGLLANAADAVDAAPVEHREIRVSLQGRGDRVEFRVSDNGAGIAREDLTRIFHAGFGAAPDRRGASLHKLANLATAAGGSLTADSPGPGRGATFTLVLPNRGERVAPPCS